MRKFYLRLLGFIGFSCLTLLSNQLIAQDTLWVEYRTEIGLCHTHTVNKGETLFGISQAYDVNIDQLLKSNNRESIQLSIGDSLYIPIDNKDMSYSCVESGFRTKSESKIVLYKVQPGDNLFHLSTRVFDVSLECLLGTETIDDYNLKVSEVLNLGKLGERLEIKNEPVDPKPFYESSLEELFWSSVKTKEAKQLNGPCSVLANTSNQPALVLFDQAEIGDIVRLYHQGSKKSTYAKVVGRVPAKLRETNQIICSDVVRKMLSINEDRFNIFVEFFK